MREERIEDQEEITFPLQIMMEELNRKIVWESSPRRRSLYQAAYGGLYILFSFQGAWKGFVTLCVFSARALILPD